MLAHKDFLPSKSRAAGVFVFIALLLLLSLLLPKTVLAARNSDCSQSYIVEEKDTLNSIAKKFSVKFSDLVDTNQMRPPYTIFVEQKLCIPKRSKIGAVGTGSAGTTRALEFTIQHTEKGFILRAENFPEKSTYRIKVDDLRYPGRDWYMAGRLNVKVDDSVQVAFELPKDLLRSNFLNICLKNQITDDLFCRYSIRYVP